MLSLEKKFSKPEPKVHFGSMLFFRLCSAVLSRCNFLKAKPDSAFNVLIKLCKDFGCLYLRIQLVSSQARLNSMHYTNIKTRTRTPMYVYIHTAWATKPAQDWSCDAKSDWS